jgi:ABC-type polysaccharide/polyol phosphate export permease
MNKIVSFFKTSSPIILILICFGIGVLAKLIELKFSDIAMGLQLITFILFVYALKRVFDKIFK